MYVTDFIKSLYLGDRGLNKVLIDCLDDRAAIQVDLISRLQPGTSEWNYYAGGDIPNGWIVFTGIRSFRFSPPGIIPNDYIASLDVSPCEVDKDGKRYFRFDLCVPACNENGHIADVFFSVEAMDVHLEDPSQPGVVIR
jgi:hypothetical protein